MKASALALALSCLLSQMTVAALCAERYVSETHSAATMAISPSMAPARFADVRRSRVLANEACELLNAGRYEEAEQKLRIVLAIEPSLASAHCNFGLLLNKTGRSREAIQHLEYAHVQAPSEAAPLLTLAAAYQLCGELSKAISLYDQYILQFPQSGDKAVIADIVAHLKAESGRLAKTVESPSNYRWNKSHLKVYVHTADGVTGFKSNFNDILKESFLSWSESGALSFEFVDDLNQADIECTWTDDTSKLASIGEGGEAILRHRGPVVTHARITLLTNRPSSNHAKLSDREVKTLCLHEIGHALGVMEHSPRPDDVMYCTLTSAAAPSEHDFVTLKDLYKASSN